MNISVINNSSIIVYSRLQHGLRIMEKFQRGSFAWIIRFILSRVASYNFNSKLRFPSEIRKKLFLELNLVYRQPIKDVFHGNASRQTLPLVFSGVVRGFISLTMCSNAYLGSAHITFHLATIPVTVVSESRFTSKSKMLFFSKTARKSVFYPIFESLCGAAHSDGLSSSL